MAIHIKCAEEHRATIAELQKKYNTLDTELKSRQKKICIVHSESHTMGQGLSQTMDLLTEIRQNLKSESEAQANQVLCQETRLDDLTTCYRDTASIQEEMVQLCVSFEAQEELSRQEQQRIAAIHTTALDPIEQALEHTLRMIDDANIAASH